MAKKRVPPKVRAFFSEKMPEEVKDFFRREGARGGKIGGSLGGKIAASNMTPEQRSERARKAVAAREAKRMREENG